MLPIGVLTDSILESENPLLLIASQYGPNRLGRRAVERIDFPYRLLLTPFGEQDAQPVVVQGKDLSPSGLGFLHTEPILWRRVRIEGADPQLDALGMGDLVAKVQIRWCRFVAPGKYESGGRIRWE